MGWVAWSLAHLVSFLYLKSICCSVALFHPLWALESHVHRSFWQPPSTCVCDLVYHQFFVELVHTRPLPSPLLQSTRRICLSVWLRDPQLRVRPTFLAMALGARSQRFAAAAGGGPEAARLGERMCSLRRNFFFFSSCTTDLRCRLRLLRLLGALAFRSHPCSNTSRRLQTR